MRKGSRGREHTGFVPKTSQADRGTIIEVDKNSTRQDWGALTHCLNNLAWELVAIRPSKYSGPMVRIRYRFGKGGVAKRYVQRSSGEDDEEDEHPDE